MSSPGTGGSDRVILNIKRPATAVAPSSNTRNVRTSKEIFGNKSSIPIPESEHEIEILSKNYHPGICLINSTGIDKFTLQDSRDESLRISQCLKDKSLLLDDNLFSDEETPYLKKSDRVEVQNAFNKLAAIARDNLRHASLNDSPTSREILTSYKGLEVLSGTKEK